MPKEGDSNRDAFRAWMRALPTGPGDDGGDEVVWRDEYKPTGPGDDGGDEVVWRDEYKPTGPGDDGGDEVV